MPFVSTLLLLTVAAGAAPVHEIMPGHLRPEARILLDTRCGDIEWSGAARVPIGLQDAIRWMYQSEFSP